MGLWIRKKCIMQINCPLNYKHFVGVSEKIDGITKGNCKLSTYLMNDKNPNRFREAQTLDSKMHGTLKFSVFRLLLTNGSLSIEDAVPSDEGVYQCAVHVTQSATGQSWTFVSRRAVFKLPTLPKFEHEPSSQKVFVGQRAAFRCLLVSFRK